MLRPRHRARGRQPLPAERAKLSAEAAAKLSEDVQHQSSSIVFALPMVPPLQKIAARLEAAVAAAVKATAAEQAAKADAAALRDR